MTLVRLYRKRLAVAMCPRLEAGFYRQGGPLCLGELSDRKDIVWTDSDTVFLTLAFCVVNDGNDYLRLLAAFTFSRAGRHWGPRVSETRTVTCEYVPNKDAAPSMSMRGNVCAVPQGNETHGGGYVIPIASVTLM
jgi:hypothetical protein